MIKTDQTHGASLKEIRAREKKQKDEELRLKCEMLAVGRYGKEDLEKWSKQYNGLWFLPVVADNGEIEAMAVMKPITRHILSYATTKITDEGLYAFLEAAMNECFIEGDRKIIDDDEYFIPASTAFNAILEGKKANMLKR